jgi:hypothetical protein
MKWAGVCVCVCVCIISVNVFLFASNTRRKHLSVEASKFPIFDYSTVDVHVDHFGIPDKISVCRLAMLRKASCLLCSVSSRMVV